ncbi:undecaprenyl-phosphate glucose phosphotransferase, partial [Salmonella enterica subsp. enterica serovar Infantis]
MLGGITDFYRSLIGVKMSTVLTLLLKNCTLSLFLSAVLVAFNYDFDNRIATFMDCYSLYSLGLVLCLSFISLGACCLRNSGYNTLRVAV